MAWPEWPWPPQILRQIYATATSYQLLSAVDIATIRTVECTFIYRTLLGGSPTEKSSTVAIEPPAFAKHTRSATPPHAASPQRHPTAHAAATRCRHASKWTKKYRTLLFKSGQNWKQPSAALPTSFDRRNRCAAPVGTWNTWYVLSATLKIVAELEICAAPLQTTQSCMCQYSNGVTTWRRVLKRVVNTSTVHNVRNKK